MQFPFEILFIGFNLISALFVYKTNGLSAYLKIFSLFLLLTFLVEIAGWYLGSKKVNTTLLYNIFTSFEFVFYFWLLRHNIRNHRVKKIILYSILVYPLLVLLELIFFTRPGGFHSTTYALGCLMVVAISIYYFYELFQLSHSVNLVRESSFWIGSGLLFYYTCSFPIICLVNYISQLSSIIVNNLGIILLLLNCLLYISFSIAFLCRIRTRKSIS